MTPAMNCKGAVFDLHGVIAQTARVHFAVINREGDEVYQSTIALVKDLISSGIKVAAATADQDVGSPLFLKNIQQGF